MTMVNGNWTGWTVRLDLKENHLFEDAVNLYYADVAGDPVYAYSFDLSLPEVQTCGMNLMREVAPRGGDGLGPENKNGEGACRTCQYGSCDEFT